jgi:hypothetical protein
MMSISIIIETVTIFFPSCLHIFLKYYTYLELDPMCFDSRIIYVRSIALLSIIIFFYWNHELDWTVWYAWSGVDENHKKKFHLTNSENVGKNANKICMQRLKSQKDTSSWYFRFDWLKSQSFFFGLSKKFNLL